MSYTQRIGSRQWRLIYIYLSDFLKFIQGTKKSADVLSRQFSGWPAQVHNGACCHWNMVRGIPCIAGLPTGQKRAFGLE